MENFSYSQDFELLEELPTELYQVLTPNLLQRMIANMRFGTIREISQICNVDQDTVISALTGGHRDDLIMQITLQKFMKHYEDYYGGKFSLSSLAILFEQETVCSA